MKYLPRLNLLRDFAGRASDAFGRISHTAAVAAIAAQVTVVWALCGALLMGAAPAATGIRGSETADAALVRLTSTSPKDLNAALGEDETDIVRLQDLTPDQARAWNAANPISNSSNPAAKPFHLATEGMLDEARAVDCLTAAVYYEAAYESVEGQRAVAQVVLNRMRHPAYPKSVCGVVFQGSERVTGCQFTFTCDGSLKRTPSEAGWSRARQVARAALDGYVMKKVGNATHYHAVYVAPYWSPNLVKVAAIGAHVFYRWTGGWGRPPAFSGQYAGVETDSFKIAALDGISGGTAMDVAEPAAAKPTAAEVPVVVAPVVMAPAGATQAAAQEILSVADVAVDAVALVPAEQLDWAGRPKAQGPSRVAAAF